MSSVAPLPSACPPPPSSFQQLLDQYRHHALSVRCVAEDTVDTELLYVKRFLAGFDSSRTPAKLFSRLAPTCVGDFLLDYAKEHGPGSQGWMQYSLRSFLRFAWQSRYAERDMSFLVPSVRKRRMGQVPRAIPEDCLVALQNSIESDTAAGLRDSAIVCLLATYGVRGVQLRRLRLEHLDWRGDRVHFPAAKGGRCIDQHLTANAGNRLAEYITRARPSSSHPEVFLTLTEPFRPLPSATHLSAILHRRIDRAGLEFPEGVSHGTHGFRHAFATRMTGRVPFKDVVDMLGHRDPASTLIYGKVSLEELRQAALPWPGGEQ
jgi:site-specific recombinase XerD